MIIALIEFYKVVWDESNLLEIEEELIELVTDHMMKGNIQKVVFSFFKLETDIKKGILIEKYKEYINMQPEHVGIAEQFALNSSSPIMEIYQNMISLNTRINDTIVDESDLSSNNGDENSSNFQTWYNRSLSNEEEEKVKVINDDLDCEFIDDFQKNKNQFWTSQYKEQVERNLGVNNTANNKFNDVQKPRSRFFSDKRLHSCSITLEDIKRRLKEKPYLKAIEHLRKLEEIEEPRKKLKLLGEVNLKVLEWIDDFWK